MLSSLGHWIIERRYPLYLESDLFWEYLLCVDLLTPEPFDDTNKFLGKYFCAFYFLSLNSRISTEAYIK